jgi:F0F1-type ATP synthase assembly protein I
VQIPPDERDDVARAFAWAWRIITLSVEIVVFALLGYGIDRWLGTRAVFTLIGLGLGGGVSFWHLMRLLALDEKRTNRKDT